jgi:hypothetical protein
MKTSLQAAVLLLAAGFLPAQAKNEREATVGMRATIEQLVLPGSELIAAPSTPKAKVVLRVLRTWPHGEHLRYDLEWTGLEAGKYDLAAYLLRRDGSAVGALPPIEVTVTSVLGSGAVEPNELDPRAADRLDGYERLQWAFGAVWVAGLLAILLVGRRWRRPKTELRRPPTLADRLRPLVERVAAGHASDAENAELERLLVAFWRARLSLGEQKAGDAIVAIRRHPEAGALLRQVEAWLHMPSSPERPDLASLLEPYRHVTAEGMQPLANAGGR